MKWWAGFKQFRVGLNLFSQIGLLFGVFLLLYLILMNHNRRFDLTQEKVHTLSPKSLEVLKSLKDATIGIKAFMQEGDPARGPLGDLLSQYAFENPKIRYEFVDPNRKPGLARAYRIEEFGTIVLEWGEKREKIQEVSEEAVTNALLKLSQFEKKKVLFAKGHGEPDSDSESPQGYGGLKQKLLDENYEVTEVNLSRESIPPDTHAVVIAGPKVDYLVEETDAVKKFLEGGGKALLLIDPQEGEPFLNLAGLIRSYGIELGQDFVVDKLSRLFGADYLIPVVTQYEEHPVTKNFSLACFLPIAQSVNGVRDPGEGLSVTPIAFTSQGSWAEKNIQGIREGQASFEEGVDQPGPVPLMAVAEKEEAKLRLVVFGDSDFVNNTHLGLSGNRDFFLNSLAWAVGEEKLVTIRPKVRENQPLLLKARDQTFVFVVPVFVLPILSLGAGVFVLLYRRKFS